MKRIILEYSSLPLFGSFNRENEKFIPLFESLSERDLNGTREQSLLFISLKYQIFIPPKLEGIRGNEIRLNEFFTKTPKIPLYIQLFNLK